MIRISQVTWAVCSLFATAFCASASFVDNPAALDPNATVLWSQLGAPSTTIPLSFGALSSGGVRVFGSLPGGGGTVAEACPAPNCDFAAGPGINPGDSLVWTENASGSGTGPLFFNFASPVRGAGLYLELTAPATFTANLFVATATGSLSESVNSDSSGDPVFLGVLDPSADVLSLAVGALSCVPSSPGGCDPSDFAVGTLLLTTPVPEPGTFPLLILVFAIMGFCFRSLGNRDAMKRTMPSDLFLALFVAAILPSAYAQTSMPYQAGEAQFENGTKAARNLPKPDLSFAAPQLTTGSLPVWNYQIIPPANLNGLPYSGYMVGQNPFNRGARTTTIPTILIPVIITFHNTSSGFTATFDPTGTPDAGCTAGLDAMNLVENSPIFQSTDWTINGVNVGFTQYIDAFQRANFWQYVQNSGDSYHTLLDYTRGDPLTIPVSYASPTLAAEVRTGVSGPCTNPAGSGSTNGSGYEGFVAMSTVDAAFRAYIASHAITPDQLPVFILYNVVMPNLNNPGFYTGGYHASLAGFPQRLTSPGQTYAVADFQTNFFYSKPDLDISFLTHEIAEWMNDPSGENSTPLWGNIGQVNGCQGNLEVGDPLTGTNLPEIAGPNGFAYHVQELAFFSWFFRTLPTGAGGLFSNSGTFTSDAGPICQ